MSKDAKGSGEKLIGTNPLARANYFIEEVLEAGLVLTGTEIKSLRTQAPNLRDSFVEIRAHGAAQEAWLLNCHIAPYSHGNIWNHDPLRKRKLLLHRRQIDQIFGAITQKGLSVIPTRIYLKNGCAKIELGLGKGKKKYDKRESLKKKSAEREMDIARKMGK
ncbi:MAG: SsrA-binding protein SmpB [Oligoflexia bacterium]|nr:SsrA-binding protein SmpB [Oligoflexia bacterium]